MKRLLDPNAQKTHYIVDVKRKRTAVRAHSPFPSLLVESESQTTLRYALYERVWGHQLAAIQRLLNSANDRLFGQLLRFVLSALPTKLATAFLALSSNTANNLRILDDFTRHVTDLGNPHIRIVNLNSKVCFNIKAAMREVVKQILEPREVGVEMRDEFRGSTEEADVKEEDISDADNSLDEDDEFKDAEEDQEAEEEDNEVEEKGTAGAKDYDRDGRISYDFEIIQDWVNHYRSTISKDLRIIVILEDSDGFSNEVLNQLIQLFCVYSKRAPIKLIMGLSSRNVSDWINVNITSKLRTLISGCKLEAKDNKDIGFQVIDDILLQNEITPENPLLLDAQLSLIILTRFENSNNSIDSLITELKLTYMIHFYQLPLASMVDPFFEPEKFHFSCLRKLASFKTYMEVLLHQFAQEKSESAKQEIYDLLDDDVKLFDLFKESRDRFQKYQNSVMNAIHIIHELSANQKHRFEIYKLVTNNQLVNSVYLSDVLKRVKNFSKSEVAEVVRFIHSDSVKETLKGCVDEDVQKLRSNLSHDSETFLEDITKYLHGNPNLNMKISDNLFNEVLTINGGSSELDKLHPTLTIEENYENLMINLIRPKLRETLENGLEEPQRYLRNALVVEESGTFEKLSRLHGPMLSRLYQVYKDAPVNINIWDFFVAFRLSLLKGELLAEIRENLSEADSELKEQAESILKGIDESDGRWDRLAYSWFLQSSFELVSMGFLREKSKGDYVEKMIWRNL